LPLLLFIVVPVVEIALFIQVGGLIGLWPTIAVIVLTALAGSALLRAQGLAVLAQARREIDAGRVPVARIADGLFLLVAAVLLLTPGFMTDALGLLLFVPGVRTAIGKKVLAWFSAHGRVEVHGYRAGPRRPDSRRPSETPDIIEGEAVEIDMDEPPGDGSGWTRRP
jgi:UPF0716 protein FxsA